MSDERMCDGSGYIQYDAGNGYTEERNCPGCLSCQDDPELLARIAALEAENERLEARGSIVQFERDKLVEFIRDDLECECDSYHGFVCGRCMTLRALAPEQTEGES